MCICVSVFHAKTQFLTRIKFSTRKIEGFLKIPSEEDFIYLWIDCNSWGLNSFSFLFGCFFSL